MAVHYQSKGPFSMTPMDRPLWLKTVHFRVTVHFHPFGPSTLDLTHQNNRYPVPKWPIFLTKMVVIQMTVIWKDHQNDRYSSNKKITVILVSSTLTFKIKFQNRVGQNNGYFNLDFHGLTVILVFDSGHFRTHSWWVTMSHDESLWVNISILTHGHSSDY